MELIFSKKNPSFPLCLIASSGWLVFWLCPECFIWEHIKCITRNIRGWNDDLDHNPKDLSHKQHHHIHHDHHHYQEVNATTIIAIHWSLKKYCAIFSTEKKKGFNLNFSRNVNFWAFSRKLFSHFHISPQMHIFLLMLLCPLLTVNCCNFTWGKEEPCKELKIFLQNYQLYP